MPFRRSALECNKHSLVLNGLNEIKSVLYSYAGSVGTLNQLCGSLTKAKETGQ
jgi:hypothetical protein